MARVIRQINDWMAERPYWEQACFDVIYQNISLSGSDYDLLLQYMLQDGGLLPMPPERPNLSFYQHAQDVSVEDVESNILIKELSNLQNINALAENQRLTFHPQLTVIFGANGSGKSGYARVLGNASFTRGDKEILPNINHLYREGLAQTADILVEVDGVEKRLVHKIGSKNPYLDSYYMFDTTSVFAHLSGENQMSFSPAGLGILAQLVEVTDQVRNHLDLEIDKRKRANTFANGLSGDSYIKTWLQDIDAYTNLDELERYSRWSDEDKNEYEALDRQIAALKSENLKEIIVKLDQKIKDVDQLKEDFQRLDDNLNKDHQKSLLSQVENLKMYRSRLDFFQDQDKLDDWITFIEAARDYADTFDDYPSDQDKCLFCHQSLSGDAVKFIHGLWNKLEDNTYQNFNIISKEIDDQIQDLKRLNSNLLDEQKAVYRLLQEDNPETLANCKAYIHNYEALLTNLIINLEKQTKFDLQNLPRISELGLDKLIEKYRREINDIQEREVEKEIVSLSEKKIELEHRKYIHLIKDELNDFISNLQWISRALRNSVRGNSRSITRKHGEIFKSLVTDEYIRLFHETLKELCCPMRLQIVTRNKKGTTYRQISLNPEVEDSDKLPTPNKVLSEGEQRAVALADFFTEVALDTNSRGVILDDPITSLDFAWQEIVSKYVVQEAERQQVVVFTHDLHFMHCLTRIAEDRVEFETHSIEKRQNTPGLVFLNNSPGVEGNYKNARIPLEIWNEARGIEVPPVQVERLLKEGFGALRSCYEYLIIYKIFANVVQRFGARISVDRMINVCIDPQIHEEIIDKVGLLSRYIEGHLQSDILNAQKPTPDLLKNEIDDYQEICSKIKASINSKR